MLIIAAISKVMIICKRQSNHKLKIKIKGEVLNKRCNRMARNATKYKIILIWGHQ